MSLNDSHGATASFDDTLLSVGGGSGAKGGAERPGRGGTANPIDCGRVPFAGACALIMTGGRDLAFGGARGMGGGGARAIGAGT